MIARRGPLWWTAHAVAVALIAPCCFDAIVETDAGFHIVVGRQILHSGFPRTNGFSWIARDQPWTTTYWLFEVLCAALVDTIGLLGLQLLTFALGVATLALLGRLLGPRGVALLPGMAILLESRLRPRPHVVTWVALAAALCLCLAARRLGPRWRWLAVGVVALNVNFHAGAAFTATVVGIFFLEAFLRTRDPWELAGGAAAGLALLASPTGFYSVRYLFAHLGVQELLPLTEFGPPRFPASLFFVVLAPLALFIGWRRWREGGALPVVAAVFAVLGLFAARMQFEFLIVAAPLFGEGVEWMANALGPRLPAMVGTLAALLAVVQIRFDARLAALDLGPRFDAAVLPVRAAQFIAAEHLEGPHFNSYDDGGYLMYALPDLPVFLDGRLHAYPDSLYQRLRAAQETPAAFDRFLREVGAGWAVIQRQRVQTSGSGLLDALPGWALVYWDDLDEIFVRRDLPQWASLIVRQEPHFMRPGLFVTLMAAAPRESWSAAEAEVDRFARYSPHDRSGELARCILRTRREGSDLAQCAEVLAAR